MRPRVTTRQTCCCRRSRTLPGRGRGSRSDHGQWRGWSGCAGCHALASGPVDLAPPVTHRSKPDRIDQACVLFAHQRDAILKFASTMQVQPDGRISVSDKASNEHTKPELLVWPAIGRRHRRLRPRAQRRRNLLDGGFEGAIYPGNPKHTMLAGRTTYPGVAMLGTAPDLAIVCTPPATVPGIIAQLGAAGTRAAIVLTAGPDAVHDVSGRTLKQAALDEARPYLVRLLGRTASGCWSPACSIGPGRAALA
jgi:hypothetical protein